MSDVAAEGITDDRFAGVRTVFDAHLASGEDLGASFCATLEGETVVDLWGGYADPGRTRPWVRDTIVNVYSTTKTMTALVALILADRGELDFDAPVVRYWPEFAAGARRCGPRTSTTGRRSPPCSPRRRPSGNRGPRPATTP